MNDNLIAVSQQNIYQYTIIYACLTKQQLVET